MIASFVFIAVVVSGVIAIWRLGDTSHGRATKRLIIIAFAVLVVVTILFPETTTAAASIIGIGRGSDLVFYLTSIGLMFLAALTYISIRRVEVRIAEMVANQAVADALHRLESDGGQAPPKL